MAKAQVNGRHPPQDFRLWCPGRQQVTGVTCQMYLSGSHTVAPEGVVEEGGGTRESEAAPHRTLEASTVKTHCSLELSHTTLM